MTTNGRLFIFGIGYAGHEIARRAQAAGWSVAGTVTTAEKAAALRLGGIAAELFDGPRSRPGEALAEATHVLCTIPPGASGDEALPCVHTVLRSRPRQPVWLGYLSTTGVYGDTGGDWVDERSPLRPAQPRSRHRVAAERGWQEAGQEHGIPVDFFRLPAIYGPGRSAFDQLRAGTARRIDKPGQVFSRIHVEDLAGAVLSAMARPAAAAGAIYNVADDAPSPQAEVIAFAARLLGWPVPPLVSYAEVAPTMSEMARSFYAENRRVRNDRIKHELGVVLKYPSYREGLAAILAGEAAVQRTETP